MTQLIIIGLIGWSVFLIAALLLLRSMLVLTGKVAINEFSPYGSNLGEAHQRYMRALYNSLENLPILIGTLLTAVVMGMTDLSDQVASFILLARMAQTIVHVISTSPIAVAARVTFYVVQLGLCGYLLVQMAMAYI
jgi:uncharacterized MAPEG superfamily protein